MYDIAVRVWGARGGVLGSQGLRALGSWGLGGMGFRYRVEGLGFRAK